MASKAVCPALAYLVVYVEDVLKSAEFYAAAFGYSVRRVEDSRK
jgi:predicted enzyme related to lactoylglutathione lyase